ncbi:MAG: hypothetical protein WBA97_01320 [Actinophytocola sp.]|uniref:arsenate reductase/protein-tyrosine-phosphatase family protein n=1 Tax=Actinophytocola sp. TaxID=1872138 RepID=UPI003C77366E
MRTGLLFVCRANECRSAVARLRMTHVLACTGAQRSIDVTSAGLSARPGLPILPVCAELLADAGPSVAEFRTRPLEVDLLRTADVVVAMTRAELNEVLRRSPASLPVAVTLGELAQTCRFMPRAAPAGPGVRLRGLVRWTVRHRGSNGTADTDIPDPAGQPLETVRAAAATVIRHVDTVAVHLTRTAVPAGRPS